MLGISDDVWYAYDKEGDVTDYIEINHSACWNNVNVDVFTGKYDYNNGAPLDKNMWTIEMLMESDSNFESNYKNKKFSYENGKINGESAASWANQATKKMNPNGFKFGSAITLKVQILLENVIFVQLLIIMVKDLIIIIVKNVLDILLIVQVSIIELIMYYHILLLNGKIIGVGMVKRQSNKALLKLLKNLVILIQHLRIFILLETKLLKLLWLINFLILLLLIKPFLV